jgi:hypothetical protein
VQLGARDDDQRARPISTTKTQTQAADTNRPAIARPLPLRFPLLIRTRAVIPNATENRTPPRMPSTSPAIAKPSICCERSVGGYGAAEG